MQDFDSQAKALQANIEQELQDGTLNFPTSLDASLRIKKLADDPDASLDDIAKVVMAEPVLSARCVRMANTVATNPYGSPVSGVMEAVRRIGLTALRSVAFAVAAEQLSRDQRSRNMRIVASGLWMHSIDVACWAHALARESRTVPADAALLAGIMVDIGQFFLIARASAFPTMENHIDRFAAFVAAWSEPVGRAILARFDLPPEIIDAYADEEAYSGAWPPATLADVVLIARIASAAPNPIHNLMGLPRRQIEDVLPASVGPDLVQTMTAAARPARNEMHAALSG